jgi:hypothetical protein
MTLDWVLEWTLDLLATYTHNSEIQVITASPLISTIHKSPQHMLRVSSLLCLHQPFPGNGFNSGDSSASELKSSLNGGSPGTDSFLHRLPYRTDLIAATVFLITPRHGPLRQHRSFSYALPPERVHRVVI